MMAGDTWDDKFGHGNFHRRSHRIYPSARDPSAHADELPKIWTSRAARAHPDDSWQQARLAFFEPAVATVLPGGGLEHSRRQR